MEKIIENCINCSKKMNALQEKISLILSNQSKLLERIEGHFTNGFRQEIKDHSERQTEKLNDSLYHINDKLLLLNNTIGKPSFWIKIGTGFILSLVALLTSTNKLLNNYGQQHNTTQSKQIKQVEK